MEKLICCVIFLVVVLIWLMILNTTGAYKSRKYRNDELKSNDKISFVSTPVFINEDGLMLLALFIRATKVERYSNKSMDEWGNNFKGFTLYFNDKDPLNIVYLKNTAINIYDTKTNEVKHSISIEECDIEKLINMISRAHYFYEEGKDENVWN